MIENHNKKIMKKTDNGFSKNRCYNKKNCFVLWTYKAHNEERVQ